MRAAGQGSSRDRLLKAAKTLFSQRGFEATTTAAIAKAAHTSQSQLIKHFGDKHGLLRAALQEAWHQLVPAVTLAIARVPKPAEQLRLALNMFLSVIEKDAPTAAVLSLDAGCVHEPGGGPFVSAGYQQFCSIVDGIVEAMRMQGELRAEVHPAALRAILMGCLERFVRDRSASSSGTRYSETDLQIVIFRLLAGCAPTKAIEAGEAAQAQTVSVPLELAAGPDDDAWIRQYTGLAEALLKTPPGEA